MGLNGARLASSTVLQKMALPLRHACGGLGLWMTSSNEADTAFLPDAAVAQAALYGGMDTCLPFNGACWLPLLDVWQRVFDACAEVCVWAPDTRNLPATFVEETLP